MCIALVLFSLIPILSGYAIYLAVATIVTEGSPAVQFTLAALLGVALLIGSWRLFWRLHALYPQKHSPTGSDTYTEHEYE